MASAPYKTAVFNLDNEPAGSNNSALFMKIIIQNNKLQSNLLFQLEIIVKYR